MFKKNNSIDLNYQSDGLYLLSNKSKLYIKLNGEVDINIENIKTKIKKNFIRFNLKNNILYIYIENNNFVIKLKKLNHLVFIDIWDDNKEIMKVRW